MFIAHVTDSANPFLNLIIKTNMINGRKWEQAWI